MDFDARPNLSQGRGRRAVVSLLIASAFTAFLFYYLARTTTLQDWVKLYASLDYRYLAAYLGLFLSSMLLKAQRYCMLLRASGLAQTPRLGQLTVITFVSNLFVDLLPARSGSLAYIVFLNRKLGVHLPACFSSFAFSFIFDLLGMLPLLLAAVAIRGLVQGKGDYLLWLLLLALAGISLLILAFLENLTRLVAGWLGRLGASGQQGLRRLLSRAAQELHNIAADIVRVKQQRVYGRLLAISVAIRLAKYLGLYLLVSGLAAQWGSGVIDSLSFPVVLFALLTAEATASLPVSGIAGFGAYEGVMMATLLAAGLSTLQASLLSFGLHLLTQTIDYTLGSAALLYLSLWPNPPEPEE